MITKDDALRAFDQPLQILLKVAAVRTVTVDHARRTFGQLPDTIAPARLEAFCREVAFHFDVATQELQEPSRRALIEASAVFLLNEAPDMLADQARETAKTVAEGGGAGGADIVPLRK
jgi:hypothetical protein